MYNLKKLDVSLINNHSVEDVLLNKMVMENRAKSVSPEFILEYEDEDCVLYFYDLIAYMMFYNKDFNGKCIDNDIINIMKNLDLAESEKDFISINKDEYKVLINKLTTGRVSNELMESLVILYIYNEACIENEFLLSIGSLKREEYDKRMNGLLTAKLKMQKTILTSYINNEVKYVYKYVVTQQPEIKKNVTVNEKRLEKLKKLGITYIHKNDGKITKTFGVKIKGSKKEKNSVKRKTKIKV